MQNSLQNATAHSKRFIGSTVTVFHFTPRIYVAGLHPLVNRRPIC